MRQLVVISTNPLIIHIYYLFELKFLRKCLKKNFFYFIPTIHLLPTYSFHCVQKMVRGDDFCGLSYLQVHNITICMSAPACLSHVRSIYVVLVYTVWSGGRRGDQVPGTGGLTAGQWEEMSTVQYSTALYITVQYCEYDRQATDLINKA